MEPSLTTIKPPVAGTTKTVDYAFLQAWTEGSRSESVWKESAWIEGGGGGITSNRGTMSLPSQPQSTPKLLMPGRSPDDDGMKSDQLSIESSKKHETAGHRSTVHPMSSDRALMALLTGEERAERGLINSMESRQLRVQTMSGDDWLSATDGERPPLGSNVPFETFYEHAIVSDNRQQTQRSPQLGTRKGTTRVPLTTTGGPFPSSRPPRLMNRSSTISVHASGTSQISADDKSTASAASADEKAKVLRAARKTRMMNLMHHNGIYGLETTAFSNISNIGDHQTQFSLQNSSLASTTPAQPPRRHRRGASRAQAVLDSIQETVNQTCYDEVFKSSTNVPVAHTSLPSPATSSDNHNKPIPRPTFIRNRSVSVGLTEADELLANTLISPAEHAVTAPSTDFATDFGYRYNHLKCEQSNSQPISTSLSKTLPDKNSKDVNATDDDESTSYINSSSSPSPTSDDVELGEHMPLLSERQVQIIGRDPKTAVSYDSGCSSSNLMDLSNCNNKMPHSNLDKIASTTSFSITDTSKLKSSIFRKNRKSRSMMSRVKDFFIKCCDPMYLMNSFFLAFRKSYFVLASIPLCSISLLLFYFLGNPKFSFLPGEATLAWWLNFFGRQCITLELARFTQYLLIDCAVLRTPMAVQLLGPFVTLLCIQSRGWPFVVSAWGTLNLFLLHGDMPFQLHWLYFTNISFYLQANSGSYVLASDLYLRVLVSLIIAGMASTIKRSMVAVMFGKRTFSMFKERLENILKEVVLLSEVAELAEEAEKLSTTGSNDMYYTSNQCKVHFLGTDFNWHRERRTTTNGEANKTLTEHDDADTDDDLTANSADDQDNFSTDDNPKSLKNSRNLRVKDLLEKWEEPVNKMDKSMDTSIRDILRFRRALTFIDDSNPFGEAFGPASNRDQVLNSAELVYHRLLTLCPEKTILSYDVFEMLVDEQDSKLANIAKNKTLKKMFRPDANRELSLLAFLQSCDSIYKKLRFFRASVGNASVIDKALEGMLNGIFYFVLGLCILSIMRINPWPLLVSMSTLLVSISFAVGSSASKYIEGVILVAVRRPFDLGDRIYMMEPSNINGDALSYSWFIEDINLSYTTVRYASTNEVATLSNGSIAGLRIVNGNRSPNAVVLFTIPFHISIVTSKKDKLTALRSALDKYARDHPNHWKCFMYCRLDVAHVDKEQAMMGIGFQHRSSWQDVGRIMSAKSDLVSYVYELSKTLGVAYSDLPQRGLLFHAGVLREGSPHEGGFVKDLVNAENILASSINSNELLLANTNAKTEANLQNTSETGFTA